MAEGAPKTIGEDGLFKLLTWNSLAITRLFGLPEIQGEPIQQEYECPMRRRVDRLYRLADGSLRNIEHQSSLRDKDALSRLLITYHVLIKEQFPDVALLQIGDRKMWIEDVKDSPLVQEIVDIAGKLRLEAAVKQGRDEGQRLGLAMALVRHANRRGLALPRSEVATLDLLVRGPTKIRSWA